MLRREFEITVVGSYLSKGSAHVFRRRVFVLLSLAAAAAVGIGCWLYGHFLEPNWIDVPVRTLRTPKLQTAGFRIVQVTDLHCDWKIRNEEKMVRIINDLKPDIVVATGDYLNHRLGLPHLRDSLKRLDARGWRLGEDRGGQARNLL